jgi:gliding motility-associated-like protein
MRFFLLILFVVLGYCWANAQSNTLRIIENKGQWPQEVLFKANLESGSFYLENNRFTFNFLDSEYLFRKHQQHAGIPIEKPLEDFIRGHAYRVNFIGSHVPVLNSEGPSKDYFNYFIGNEPDKWASKARAFERVELKGLYPNIDLQVYSKGSSLKYDLILHPGANINNITIDYEGVDKLQLKNGALLIVTSVNTIIEEAPFAYQVINNKVFPVKCRYTLKNNRLGFEVNGSYNPLIPLVIDPELIFSTYSGSTADNFGFTATYDNEGYLYSGSSIFGNGYPTTVGAYQTSFAGGTGQGTLVGTDIGITKYNLTGTGLVYSTYIGGASDELPHSLIVNEQGELYVYGSTSSANYPTTGGAFQTTFGGGSAFTPSGIGVSYVNGSDIIVSRLSNNGTQLLSSTFVGGSGNDGLNTIAALKFNYADEMRGEILLDDNDDVIVASTTLSSNFPITAGAFQSTYAGGQDGCAFKLSANLSTLMWSTYLGGSAADATYSVELDSQNNVVLTGGTTSANFPVTAGVVYGGYMGGQADGYITKLSSNAGSILQSTYYGTNLYDQSYFVELDNDDNIYIFGQTNGPQGALIQNASFFTPNGGMIVAKLSPNLNNIIWSTRFGSGVSSNPNLSPTAFLVDVCNKIYMSGWGGQTNVSSNNQTGYTTGLPTTADAYQNTTNGSDFYILVIEEDASAITYASFFGGLTSNEHVDGGTSRFDRSGKIYQSVCAGCGNNDDFPIFPPNAWSPTNNSNNCNNGVFKFDFQLPITVANFTGESVCLPDVVDIVNLSNGATGYQWYVNGQLVSNDANPGLTFSSPGIQLVTLIASSPNTCNLTDSITKEITVYPELLLEVPDDIILCEPQSVELIANSFGSAFTFHWSTSPNFSNQLNISLLDSSVVVNPTEPTTYYVRVDNGFCQEVADILVIPAPQAQISILNPSACAGDTVQVDLLNLTPGVNFSSITWSPNTGILNGQGTNQIQLVVGENYYLVVDVVTQNNCFITDSVLIEAYEIFLSVSNDTIICAEGQQVVLTADAGGQANDFIWSTNPNFSNPINNPQDSVITVNPSATTTYYVRVENGNCVRTDEVTVFVVTGSAALQTEYLICLNDILQIQVINQIPGLELSYNWQPENLIISGQGTSTISVSPPSTTVYTVTITTADGCVFSRSTTVTVSSINATGANATADPNAIPTGGSSTLFATPNNAAYNYSWSPPATLSNPNSSSTTATPPQTTDYTVTITDGNAQIGFCTGTATVRVIVYDFVCGEPTIFIPNAFTPNGDGNNDLLFVRGENIERMYLAIYNRWGELVFDTNDQSIGWDGTYRGKPVDPAVFVYHLDLDCVDGQNYLKKGNVTVIR